MKKRRPMKRSKPRKGPRVAVVRERWCMRREAWVPAVVWPYPLFRFGLVERHTMWCV